MRKRTGKRLAEHMAECAGECIGRRDFVAGAAGAALALAGAGLTGCAAGGQRSDAADAGDAAGRGDSQEGAGALEDAGAQEVAGGAGDAGAAGAKPLPAPEADPASEFGVDANISMRTIDEWLDRDDVAYRDMRMLFDPADYGAMGGDPDLSATIEGFKVVPFPLVATLPPLPVAGAYTGLTAWKVEWSDDGSVSSAAPNYRESERLLEDLFPKDRAIFLMCGAGGYAGQMKALLAFLGWDAQKLYNVGGFWSYAGTRAVQLIERSGGETLHCMWRADVAPIDFTWMHAL